MQLQKWSSTLIGLGVTQMLLGVGVAISGVASIIGCDKYFYVNFGIPSAPTLLVCGALTISGFKCNTRMLMALSIINVLTIAFCLLALISGAIGVRCEIYGRDHIDYATKRCYDFSDTIGCKNDNWNKTYMDNKEDFRSTRKTAIVYDIILLVCGVLELILCMTAAILAVCARSSREKMQDEEIAYGSQPPFAPQYAAYQPAPPPASYPPPYLAPQTVQQQTYPGGGINISNANTVSVNTTVDSDGRSKTATTSSGEDTH